MVEIIPTILTDHNGFPQVTEQAGSTTMVYQRLPSAKETEATSEGQDQKTEYVPRIRWPDLFAQLFIHGGALYGIFLMLTVARIYTSIWGWWWNTSLFCIILNVQLVATNKENQELCVNFFHWENTVNYARNLRVTWKKILFLATIENS